LNEKKPEGTVRLEFEQDFDFGRYGNVINAGEEQELFKKEVLEPTIERMLYKVQLEKLKIFYLKWVHDNGDTREASYEKLVVPI
jgi:hypothetical protein